MSERELQQMLISVAELAGWRTMCLWDSRRQNAVGWPDLTLVRGNRMLCLELKSATGRMRPGQQEWLDALDAVPGITARVVRPCEATYIIDELQRG